MNDLPVSRRDDGGRLVEHCKQCPGCIISSSPGILHQLMGLGYELRAAEHLHEHLVDADIIVAIQDSP